MATYELDGVRPQLPADGDYFIADSAEVIGKVLSIPPKVVTSTLSKVIFGLDIGPGWADEYNKKADYLLGLKELRKKVVAADVFEPGPLKAVCASCAK